MKKNNSVDETCVLQSLSQSQPHELQEIKGKLNEVRRKSLNDKKMKKLRITKLISKRKDSNQNSSKYVSFFLIYFRLLKMKKS
jgi:hypothetical protein